MQRVYFQNLATATVLLLILLPYVLLTNFTATKLQVALHALLFWFFIPIFITLSHRFLRPKLAKKFDLPLTSQMLSDFTGLSIAAIVMVILFHIITGMPYRVMLSPYLIVALVPVYVSYAVISLLRSWREQKEYSLRLEVEQTKTAWQALSAQIKPHFLFNSLNTLEHLVDSDPTLAKKVLRHLAGLYRSILEGSRERTQSLQVELVTARYYLDIQKQRFQERLEYKFEVPEGVSLKLPSLLLLTCVENAVKHGIEPETTVGKVWVRWQENEMGSVLSVTNTIPKSVPLNATSTKFGLESMRVQLLLIKGEGASIETEHEDDSFTVRINLPSDRSDGA